MASPIFFRQFVHLAIKRRDHVCRRTKRREHMRGGQDRGMEMRNGGKETK